MPANFAPRVKQTPIKWFFLNLCEKCPLIELSSGCEYWAFWSNSAVCHLFGTFGVSQAKSDRPIKALENTSPMAFTQIEEEPINCHLTAGKASAKSLSIKSLTSQHDAVTSSCWRLRQNKFQPKSRQHRKNCLGTYSPAFVCRLSKSGWTPPAWI